MKKTLIALAVAGAAVATGVNAGELYNQDGTTLALGGRAEARMSIMDGDVSDKTRVRINISGKQEINDNLYGVGFYEAEYITNDVDSSGTITNDSANNQINNRYAYAGIGGNFGEVTYGKNDAALGVITDFTDIMDYHGGNASNKFATADRVDNLLSYAGTFGDFAVKADYRFADRIKTTSPAGYDNNEIDGYSLSGIYTVADTGLAFGLGFANQGTKTSSTTGTVGGDQWMATASYTINDLYLAALYTAKDYDNTSNDYDAFELAASYTMDKTVFYVTYGDGSRDDSVPSTTTTSSDGDFYQEVAVEAAYFFKPNFRGFVSYNFDLRDDNETSVGKAEDEAALGLRYDF
ncbi:porin [Vibrio sp. PP-XX7]